MPRSKTRPGSARRPDAAPADMLYQLYKAYEPLAGRHLWPWETQRWHELVACILTAVVEARVTPQAIQEVTRIMAWAGLLDIDSLASLQPAAGDSHAILVTMATLLEGAGFTADESHLAVSAIREAAAGLARAYQGKVQKYLRHYGALMLDDVAATFSFSALSSQAAERAFSLWLQNTLNMPVPTADPICDEACERLHVGYDALVEAADETDLNVALLDNVLRAYWEGDIQLPGDEPEG